MSDHINVREDDDQLSTTASQWTLSNSGIHGQKLAVLFVFITNHNFFFFFIQYIIFFCAAAAFVNKITIFKYEVKCGIIIITHRHETKWIFSLDFCREVADTVERHATIYLYIELAADTVLATVCLWLAKM